MHCQYIFPSIHFHLGVFVSNHRYHIHVACVADDPLLVTTQDDVAIFFEDHAFLTKDLLMSRAESIGYSWRCINAADVVLVLIGNSYGRTNISGISQLHASYTHAKALNKPMLIFAHSDVLNHPSNDRKLLDFVGSLESQGSRQVHYFDDNNDFIKLLEVNFDVLDFDRAKGWRCIDTKTDVAAQIQMPSEVHTAPETGKADSMTSDRVKSSTVTPQLPRLRTNSSLHPTLKPALALDNEFSVSCTAHAFQGGTLIEVSFVMPLRWRDIVTMLTGVVLPFSEQGFGHILNKLIDKSIASQIVMCEYPNVHAVSRMQVVKADALWILDELQLAGWVEPAGQGSLWQVTKKATQASNLAQAQDSNM